MVPVTRWFAFMLWSVSGAAHAQSGPDSPQSLQPEPSAITTAGVSVGRSGADATTSGGYTFPDRNRQFRNYLYYTFGPPGLISTAVGAGIDQGKPAPPEWDSGAQGFGERYGWRFGMNLIRETVEYSSRC
jgi:hypothetical protein